MTWVDRKISTYGNVWQRMCKWF